MLVEVGVPPAQVVAEPARRHVEVVEEPAVRRVVVEAVHDVRREDDERPRRPAERSGAERERELSLQDEERVGVVVVDVRLRSPLARPVEELRHRELVRIHEQRRAPLLGPRADSFSVIPSGPPDDDETGIARGVLGAGCWSKASRAARRSSSSSAA